MSVTRQTDRQTNPGSDKMNANLLHIYSRTPTHKTIHGSAHRDKYGRQTKIRGTVCTSFIPDVKIVLLPHKGTMVCKGEFTADYVLDASLERLQSLHNRTQGNIGRFTVQLKYLDDAKITFLCCNLCFLLDTM